MPAGIDFLNDWLTAVPIAHRGLHDTSRSIIENSSSAFAAALAGGYAIECDLQLSADGEAMVFHDARLDRLTARSGRTDSLTARQLGATPLTGTSDCPQTLAEMLEQVDGKAGLVIEMKSLWDGNTRLAQRTCEILSTYAGRAALMSFDPILVAAVRQFAPDIPRGGVSELYPPEDWPELTPEQCSELRDGKAMALAQPHFMSYSVDALPTPQVRAFRDAGKPVICWTVRDVQTADEAMNHCDQITFEGFTPER